MRECIGLLLLCAALPAAEPIEHYAVILNRPAVSGGQAPAALQATRQAVRRQVLARGARITGSAELLVDAVFVRATPGQAQQLRILPGVSRVIPLPPLRMQMDRAPSLVRLAAAWNLAGGPENAGAGTRIGIIDSGLDADHAAFRDPGLPPPADPPQSPSENAAYVNSKIIVARSYVGMLGDPEDDTSPRDRMGHGTGMAMIAAGVSNTGPAGAITGIAPKAYLGNYKVFGSPGVHDTTTASAIIAALEDAIRDRMDVVVLGIGGQPQYAPLTQDPACAGSQTPGLDIPPDSCDVLAQAVEKASQLGLTVVVPAGNDALLSALWFPTFATINTPGNAPSAITVGASRNSTYFLKFNDQSVPALFGDGPRPENGFSAPIADAGGTACSSLPEGSLQGAFALVLRGDCDMGDKVRNAQAAGAAGVIIYQAEETDVVINPLGLSETSIPTVFVGHNTGLALKGLAGTQASVDATVVAPGGSPETIAEESSRGPSIGSDPGNPSRVMPGIKPELVAPGEDLYSATQTLDSAGGLYDPSGYTFDHGTSFASAMVAGAAALVKQKNPGFSPARIKSALVNTAAAEIATDDGTTTAWLGDAGAGKLNVEAALATTVVAEPATLEFGLIGPASLPISLTLKLANTGPSPATYRLSTNQRNEDRAATVTVSPETLEVQPGEQGSVSVQLAGAQPAAGSYEGFITVEGGAGALRIPYLYMVTDQVAFDIFPIINGSFSGKPGEYFKIAFRLLDTWGAPVTGAPVQFSVRSGDGKVECPPDLASQPFCAFNAETITGTGGEGAAWIKLGATPGEQIFLVKAGGLELEFYADVQP